MLNSGLCVQRVGSEVERERAIDVDILGKKNQITPNHVTTLAFGDNYIIFRHWPRIA